jgi:hypothetical protein
MLLFQNDFNKRIFPFHHWVKTIIIRFRTLYLLLNFYLKYKLGGGPFAQGPQLKRRPPQQRRLLKFLDTRLLNWEYKSQPPLCQIIQCVIVPFYNYDVIGAPWETFPSCPVQPLGGPADVTMKFSAQIAGNVISMEAYHPLWQMRTDPLLICAECC